MDDKVAKQIADTIIGQIFGLQNPYSLDEFKNKFAFDIRMTSDVTDTITGKTTWVQNSSGNKFINFQDMIQRGDDMMRPTQPLNSIEDIMRVWQEVNYTAAERTINSVNVAKSDAIYGSQNIYQSIDMHDSKNVLFSETSLFCEYSAAIQRSNTCIYSLRVDDSNKVTKSFQVSWSGNITNSFFIKDSKNLSDCMFCSQITDRRFCIGNMQFEEAEYRKWEKLVKEWILSN